MSEISKFVAGSLQALSAMVLLELPHVNVLTKVDLLTVDSKASKIATLPCLALLWLGLAWLGLAWLGSARLGLARLGLARLGSNSKFFAGIIKIWSLVEACQG